MSKTRRKNHSEVEYLRGENKKLKSQIRRLERYVKELQRKSYFFEEVVEETVDDVSIIDTCQNCGKGILSQIEIAHLTFVICDICNFREKVNGKEAKSKKETK